MEKRIPWDDLPGPLKAAIAERTGPVTAGRAVTDGQNSPLAAVIETPGGKVFVKGLPSGHRLVITQAREAAAAPLVKGISPELLWHFDEAGWNVLGFEHVHGRAADYSPGSPDIDLVTRLMLALAAIEIPPSPGPWKPIETRLRTYVDTPADALAFAGRALTHTDWMPDNILISHGRAWLVDWAWATPGSRLDRPRVLAAKAHGPRPHRRAGRSPRCPAPRLRRRRLRPHRRVRPRQRPHVERDRAEQQEPLGQDDGAHRPHLGAPPAGHPIARPFKGRQRDKQVGVAARSLSCRRWCSRAGCR